MQIYFKLVWLSSYITSIRANVRHSSIFTKEEELLNNIKACIHLLVCLQTRFAETHLVIYKSSVNKTTKLNEKRLHVWLIVFKKIQIILL